MRFWRKNLAPWQNPTLRFTRSTPASAHGIGAAAGRARHVGRRSRRRAGRAGANGVNWAWFLSVWQTGPAGQRVSRGNPEWQNEFEETLPDLREEDIDGSGFAIVAYTVCPTACSPALRRPTVRDGQR